MKEKSTFKISNIFSNSWVITLSATLIGVFLALYLNEWVASKKLNAQKEIATKNITLEIKSNNKSLETTLNKHIQMLNVIKFLAKHTNSEEELIASREEMNNFRINNPNSILISDSTLLDNGNYIYTGEANSETLLPNLNLSNIAWVTLKNSAFTTQYNFNCLMYLEKLDKIVTEIKNKNEELLNYLIGKDDTGENNEHLILHLELLISFEESFIQTYKNNEEEMKMCE